MSKKCLIFETKKVRKMTISKTKASLYSSLQSKKMRTKHGLFLVEGEKCVLDTLGAFELENLVATPGWIDRNRDNQDIVNDNIVTADSAVMKKISSLSNAPEVIAVFRIPDEDNSEIVLHPDELYLMLDGVQDPGNFGTIIRTADWFGFDTVYASRDTVDLYNPKTIQSTMGSLRRVKVKYVDICSIIERSGIRNVYGTMLNGENMFETPLGRDGVIIMGNEGKGLSDEVKALVSHPLLIPPYGNGGHGESLNVAVATAITLSRFRFN